MKNEKGLYAVKDIKNVLFTCDRTEFNMDFANNVDLLNINKANVIVVDFELSSDELLKKLYKFNELSGSIEISFKVKTFKDGSFIEKKKRFDGMRLVRTLENYSAENVTNYRYIFSDCRYASIKKELNCYLQSFCENELLYSLRNEQALLLEKVEKSREEDNIGTYKNLILALKEITFLISREEDRLLMML